MSIKKPKRICAVKVLWFFILCKLNLFKSVHERKHMFTRDIDIYFVYKQIGHTDKSIIVGIKYINEETTYWSGSLTCWEDGTTNIIEKGTVWFPYAIFLIYNKNRVHYVSVNSKHQIIENFV